MSEITPLINSIDQVCFSALRQHHQDTVAFGPFAGMRLVDEFSWGDACLKLLGLYEHYLHPFIEEIASTYVDAVVNVGCAEGYYAVGLARILPDAQVYAYDISEVAQSVCTRMAVKNGIADRVNVSGELTVNGFQMVLEKYTYPFVFMDVEGAEAVLLRISDVPALRRSKIICECHEWLLPDGLVAFAQQFESTHELIIIDEFDLRATDIADIAYLPAQIRMALVCEKRGARMRWIYLKPKSSAAAM